MSDPFASMMLDKESGPDGSRPVVRLRDIRKQYVMGRHSRGQEAIIVHALRGVCVDVYLGESVAIMGQSGSGKSTLLNLLGCLDRPTSGEYLLDSDDVANFSDDELSEIRSRRIGFIFQSYNLIQQYTVYENIQLPLTYQGSGAISQSDHDYTLKLAELVGLSQRLDHRPMQLSGGQQQRVAIARSLINNPFIILADEATGNLDSATSDEIMAMLGRLNEEEDKTIIMVTHEDDIAEHAKRIIRMRDGQIIHDAPSERMKDAPPHVVGLGVGSGLQHQAVTSQ